MRYLLIVFSLWFISCSQTYFIVRHAEKAAPGANMTSDVPLSPAGGQRAEALKEVLRDKKIGYVYSTNTIRTRSTAQPLADLSGLPVRVYGPRPDSAFIQTLKDLDKNTLVVGHSNTVDDIVNMLCGYKAVPGDLNENQYDHLFIVRRKGSRFAFTLKKYGAKTD